MRDENALRALWDALPAIQCKGLCDDSCTAIDMSPLEHDLVREAGVDIPKHAVTKDQRCVALGTFNRCRVYESRPTVCRVFGLTRSLYCGHGCVPEGGFLEEYDAILRLQLSMLYGGAFPDDLTEERLREVAARPEVRAKVLAASLSIGWPRLPRALWSENARGPPPARVGLFVMLPRR
jgi:Fe-S-cluster containining protein